MKKYAVYYSLLNNDFKFGFICLSSDRTGSELKDNLIGYADTKKEAQKMVKDNGCVNY